MKHPKISIYTYIKSRWTCKDIDLTHWAFKSNIDSAWSFDHLCDISCRVQLILSLEKRLMELSDTLEKVRDGFLEKSADVEVLQRRADEQVRQGTNSTMRVIVVR